MRTPQDECGLNLVADEMMRDAKKPMRRSYADRIEDVRSNILDSPCNGQKAAEVARPPIVHMQSGQHA